MRVIHILKDGTSVNSISGKVIKPTDAVAIYKMIESINKKNVKRRITKC
ncbi:hypothetical protein [Peptacetobacter sp.]